jgi:ATP-binding cassette subfamily B (MDR/TAP) protein 1
LAFISVDRAHACRSIRPDLFAFFFSSSPHRSSLGQAAPNLTSFVKGKAAGYNILEMIRRKPAINVNMNQGEVLAKVEGRIELHEVTFSYPSRPDVVIFHNFSLKIPAGKTMAVVGASGSGKSTVIALIERFYDPTAGKKRKRKTVPSFSIRSRAAKRKNWIRR